MIDIEKVKAGIKELDYRYIRGFSDDTPEDYNEEAEKIAMIANEAMSAKELAMLMAEIFGHTGMSANRHLVFYNAAEKILGLNDGHICPVCRSSWFDEKGSYEICPVCCWEDDPVQSRDPYLTGGANEFSLMESQFIYHMDSRLGAEYTNDIKSQNKGGRGGLISTLADIYCEITAVKREELYKRIYGK